jgi:hypothetical protein
LFEKEGAICENCISQSIRCWADVHCSRRNADIIIVDGNPLENISDIRKVDMVIKGGQVVYEMEKKGVQPQAKLAVIWGEIKK